jgi:hypothetical protein
VVEFDVNKPDWELDLLRALLQQNIKVNETFDDVPELPWIASISTLTFYALVRGRTRSDARWRLVEAAALERLQGELRRLGWSEIDTWIEQGIEFVMGRDPSGLVWGVAPCDDDPRSRQDLLERIRREEVTDRAAAIDYRDILDPTRIQMTLDTAED